MKDLKIAVLGAVLAAAAGPLFAAPRACRDGRPVRVSGDAFAPIDCSTTTHAAAALPFLPMQPVKDAGAVLRELDGRWEGNLIHALGRYDALLTVKAGRRGKAEVALELKELQFRERLTHRLSLVAGKEPGAYEAALTTASVPDAALKGGALVGASAAPAEAPAAPERQIDLLFENGASHRIFFTTGGKDELRVSGFSAIPGAPLKKYELTLKRTKREAL